MKGLLDGGMDDVGRAAVTRRPSGAVEIPRVHLRLPAASGVARVISC
ncbi:MULTISPECIES: hypothetical protein [Streptomyces]|nr:MULTISPECIES: hypothetical protein [Streptomyces]MDX2671734.1 hypothetical protein [Streptomyces sp. NRRL_ISP-5395]GHF52758.1 hypothetical protein GCM10010504_20960 [Streptomyces griseus]